MGEPTVLPLPVLDAAWIARFAELTGETPTGLAWLWEDSGQPALAVYSAGPCSALAIGRRLTPPQLAADPTTWIADLYAEALRAYRSRARGALALERAALPRLRAEHARAMQAMVAAERRIARNEADLAAATKELARLDRLAGKDVSRG